MYVSHGCLGRRASEEWLAAPASAEYVRLTELQMIFLPQHVDGELPGDQLEVDQDGLDRCCSTANAHQKATKPDESKTQAIAARIKQDQRRGLASSDLPRTYPGAGTRTVLGE